MAGAVALFHGVAGTLTAHPAVYAVHRRVIKTWMEPPPDAKRTSTRAPDTTLIPQDRRRRVLSPYMRLWFGAEFSPKCPIPKKARFQNTPIPKPADMRTQHPA